MYVILQDIVLDFSPGPIHAVDGDRGLSSPVSYAILSGTMHTRCKSIFKMCCACMYASLTAFLFMPGDDDGHFLMDSETGEVRLIRTITDRLTTPVLELQVMVSLTYSVSVGMKDFILTALSYFLSVSCNQAYQDDDPRKYSVATVLVRVLAVNEFYPKFDRDEYQGFVIAGKNLASLVFTYGSKALMLHVKDQDFNHVCTHNTIYSHSPKILRAVLYLTNIVTHHLPCLHQLTGLQSKNSLHLQSYIESHGHLPDHTWWFSDHQDRPAQTKAETCSRGESQWKRNQWISCLISRDHITDFSYLKPATTNQNPLQVMAVDQESGEATFATVVVEVLSEGQSGKDTN